MLDAIEVVEACNWDIGNVDFGDTEPARNGVGCAKVANLVRFRLDADQRGIVEAVIA